MFLSSPYLSQHTLFAILLCNSWLYGYANEQENNPTTKNQDLTSQAQRKLDELNAAGKEQASKLGKEAEDKAGMAKSEAENKANEAKGTLSGWFGGKK